MAGARQPVDLVIVKGKKHLTKAEIEERRASEVAPATDEIVAPSYLTAAQKKHFVKLAAQLCKIKIMGETDCDTLARYVTAQTQYETVTKDLRKLQKERPQQEDFDEPAGYYHAMELWYTLHDALDRRQDRYFKQASTTARDLGLTISSRCKLVVPKAEDAAPKVNKFAKFGGGSE
jgi:P27 family predicted phage terminase small subunit